LTCGASLVHVDNVVTDYVAVAIRIPLRYQISPVPSDGINCWLDSADRSTISEREHTLILSRINPRQLVWAAPTKQRSRGAEISKF
jgi:hypothetical protein